MAPDTGVTQETHPNNLSHAALTPHSTTQKHQPRATHQPQPAASPARPGRLALARNSNMNSTAAAWRTAPLCCRLSPRRSCCAWPQRRRCWTAGEGAVGSWKDLRYDSVFFWGVGGEVGIMLFLHFTEEPLDIYYIYNLMYFDVLDCTWWSLLDVFRARLVFAWVFWFLSTVDVFMVYMILLCWFYEGFTASGCRSP